MNHIIAVALLCTVATAHAADAKIASAEKRVADMDSIKFCQRLGPALRAPTGKDEAFRAAMLRRAERAEHINYDMQAGIELRRPVMGMNLCAVLAAFGKPSRSNRSVTRHGDHYQLVYDRPRLYLYLDFKQSDYYLTSWQE